MAVRVTPGELVAHPQAVAAGSIGVDISAYSCCESLPRLISTPRPVSTPGNILRSLVGKVLPSQMFSPLLLDVLTRAEQVASAGVWQLHTEELGPDLTEAGAFLKEEGFNKECSPQLALRRSQTMPGQQHWLAL